MPALHFVSLAVMAILIGLSQAQCYGRVPIGQPLPPVVPVAPSCCPGSDNLSALLLLARAIDKPADDINSGEIINKLINALIFATTNNCSCGTGGAGGSGGSVSVTPKPQPAAKPALIDIGLLTGDDLLQLIISGQKLLNLDLGKGGGAVTNLVSGLI